MNSISITIFLLVSVLLVVQTPYAEQYIITLRQKPNIYASLAFSQRGVTVQKAIHNGFVIECPPDSIRTFLRDPNVLHVEQDHLCYALGVLDTTWNMRRVYVPEAHAVGVHGQGMLIALGDTGIDTTHPGLQGRWVDGENLQSPGGSWLDDHGHGTACAGILLGIADSAKVVPLKILNSKGQGHYSDIILALDLVAARQDVRVLSLSLGGPYPSRALADACERATIAGVVIVAAAGNSGGAVFYPAGYASVIAVSATTPADTLAGFSCYGPPIDCSAPGINIRTLAPTWQLPYPYRYINGTSAACPHVAGLAALILENYPEYAPYQVRAQIGYYAMDLGSPGLDERYGYGLIHVYQAALHREYLPGDFDLDGCVTMVDWLIFASTFGCKIGDPCYNPVADFDRDGKITLADFISGFAPNFGKCIEP